MAAPFNLIQFLARIIYLLGVECNPILQSMASPLASAPV